MIEFADANEALDLRIDEALSRWTGKRTDAPSFSRTGKGISGLRLLMETSAGVEGLVGRTLRDGVNVYTYTCRRPADDRTVEGFGSSANLAVCDAFLACDPDLFTPIGPPPAPGPSAGPGRMR
jgi:hypothetical protein